MSLILNKNRFAHILSLPNKSENNIFLCKYLFFHLQEEKLILYISFISASESYKTLFLYKKNKSRLKFIKPHFFLALIVSLIFRFQFPIGVFSQPLYVILHVNTKSCSLRKTCYLQEIKILNISNNKNQFFT